tara:strand:+ start:130 stop:303 length:174 start_codon:yes stop_codon:yes gene_type:complete
MLCCCVIEEEEQRQVFFVMVSDGVVIDKDIQILIGGIANRGFVDSNDGGGVRVEKLI